MNRCAKLLRVPVLLCLTFAPLTLFSDDGQGQWGPFEAEMNWSNAAARCEKKGMRLPTIEELKAAHRSGETASWRPIGWYWSSNDAGDSSRAWALSTGTGMAMDRPKVESGYHYVRCRKGPVREAGSPPR